MAENKYKNLKMFVGKKQAKNKMEQEYSRKIEMLMERNSQLKERVQAEKDRQFIMKDSRLAKGIDFGDPVLPSGNGIGATLLTQWIRSGAYNDKIATLNFLISDLNYFSNLFKLKGCDHIENISTRFIQSLFMTGCGAIPKGKADKEDDVEFLTFWASSAIKQTKAGNVEKGAVFLPLFIGMASRWEYPKGDQVKTNKEMFFFKCGTNPLPLIVRNQDYYKVMTKSIEIVDTNLEQTVLQWFIYSGIADEDSIEDLRCQLGNPEYKGVVIQNASEMKAIPFEEKRTKKANVETIGNTASSNQQTQIERPLVPTGLNGDVIESYKFIENVKDKILGKRFNTEQKNQKVVAGELSNSNYDFELKEEDIKKELEIGCYIRNKAPSEKKCCDKDWTVEIYESRTEKQLLEGMNTDNKDYKKGGEDGKQ